MKDRTMKKQLKLLAAATLIFTTCAAQAAEPLVLQQVMKAPGVRLVVASKN